MAAALLAANFAGVYDDDMVDIDVVVQKKTTIMRGKFHFYRIFITMVTYM
jgi:hypothetical protein